MLSTELPTEGTPSEIERRERQGIEDVEQKLVPHRRDFILNLAMTSKYPSPANHKSVTVRRSGRCRQVRGGVALGAWHAIAQQTSTRSTNTTAVAAAASRTSWWRGATPAHLLVGACARGRRRVDSRPPRPWCRASVCGLTRGRGRRPWPRPLCRPPRRRRAASAIPRRACRYGRVGARRSRGG